MSSKCSSVFVAISMILLKVSICERVTVNYAIEEEKGTDYYLGRISTGAKLRDFPEINSDAEFESLRYSLLTSGNIHAQYFTVNERTSDLYTNKTINREELCRYSNDCILHFEVAVKHNSSLFIVLFV